MDWPKSCEDNQGWIRGEGNIIEPLSTEGRNLPQQVVDLLDPDLNNKFAKNGEGVDSEESSDFEEDYEDMED